MTDARQVSMLYENVLLITTDMLGAAQSRDWKAVAELEARCSQQIELIRHSSAQITLNEAFKKQHIELIEQILDNDRAIRQITKEWMDDLSQHIGHVSVQRKLQNAYGSSDGF